MDNVDYEAIEREHEKERELDNALRQIAEMAEAIRKLTATVERLHKASGSHARRLEAIEKAAVNPAP